MSAIQLTPLLTEQEVANLLRVKVCTIRNERERGRLGSTRVGNQIRFTTDHIHQYIKNQEIKSCEERNLGQAKLETFGSAKSPAGPGRMTRGAAPGTSHDRHAVSALAHQTFAKRRSN